MKRLRQLVVLLAFCLIAVPMAAQVTEGEPVLANDGTVYRLLKGPYSEFFGSETAQAGFPVLVLEVTAVGGEPVLHLVPETATRDREASPFLLLEESSQVVYLLWEELFNGIHPLLQLTSFDGEAWTPVVEIASGPFSRKGSPQLGVTQELNLSKVDRSIAHLTWWQGGVSGPSKKFYAPIVLTGGVEQGNTPVFELSDFFAEDEAADGPMVTAFSDLLVVEPGSDPRSAVVAFVDPRTQRLRTIRSEMMPGLLTSFSDKARLEIVITGQRLNSKQALADAMRLQLTDIGDGFHPASLAYMVEGVASFIEGWQGDLTVPGELELMAEKARLEIVITGSTIDANGLPADADAYLIEVGRLADGSGEPSLLKLSKGSSWQLPTVEDEVITASLYVAESARHVLLAWEGNKFENRIYYRTTQDEGWSDASYLEIRPDLDRDTIYRLLSQQVQNR